MDSSGVMTTAASPKMKKNDSLDVAKLSASPEMGKIAHLGCCENSVKSKLRMPRSFPQICMYIYIYIYIYFIYIYIYAYTINSCKPKNWEVSSLKNA